MKVERIAAVCDQGAAAESSTGTHAPAFTPGIEMHMETKIKNLRD
jgi:hypothetical protein